MTRGSALLAINMFTERFFVAGVVALQLADALNLFANVHSCIVRCPRGRCQRAVLSAARQLGTLMSVQLDCGTDSYGGAALLTCGSHCLDQGK
jgi:hypothetical protein